MAASGPKAVMGHCSAKVRLLANSGSHGHLTEHSRRRFAGRAIGCFVELMTELTISHSVIRLFMASLRLHLTAARFMR